MYISTDNNCWADLLSRWGAEYLNTHQHSTETSNHYSIARLFQAPVAPEHDNDFVWPHIKDVRDFQLNFLETTVTPKRLVEYKTSNLLRRVTL